MLEPDKGWLILHLLLLRLGKPTPYVRDRKPAQPSAVAYEKPVAQLGDGERDFLAFLQVREIPGVCIERGSDALSIGVDICQKNVLAGAGIIVLFKERLDTDGLVSRHNSESLVLGGPGEFEEGGLGKEHLERQLRLENRPIDLRRVFPHRPFVRWPSVCFA